ncbi:hypothetical protein [Streptomyces mangrovi]|uniref:hypothetical protein n=1 Tax=Streptomyces mangrovi TaxID=1206892 RepID=UPI00399CF30C
MALDPVTATLLGTAIGAGATLAATALTGSMTRARERDHKVWERYVDAIEDALRDIQDRHNKRSAAMDSRSLSEEQIASLPLDDVLHSEVKLVLFGSRDLISAIRGSRDALRAWVAEFKQYQTVVDNPDWEYGPRDIERVWQGVEKRATQAEEAEDELLVKLREAALLRPRRRRRWRC